MDKPIVSIEAVKDEELRLQAINEFERKDDIQILQMLAGIQINEFFYKLAFKARLEDGGKVDCGDPNCKLNKDGISHIHVVDISAAGVFEVLRLMGNIEIHCTKPELETDDDTGERYWVCGARVTDKHTGYSVTLWYREPDGKYAFDKVQSKAIRNAGRKIIPQAIKSKLIQLALEGKLQITEEDIANVIKGKGVPPTQSAPHTLSNTGPALAHPPSTQTPSFKAPETSPLATERQRRFIWVKAREAGYDRDSFKKVLKEQFGYDSTKEIERYDVDNILKYLEENPAQKALSKEQVEEIVQTYVAEELDGDTKLYESIMEHISVKWGTKSIQKNELMEFLKKFYSKADFNNDVDLSEEPPF